MVTCSFSGKEIPPGKGIMYVKKDGRVLYFADRKAEKNMIQLGRKARTTKWTKAFHDEKQANKENKQ
jgi:large subunit ribosomal protein L24e